MYAFMAMFVCMYVCMYARSIYCSVSANNHVLQPPETVVCDRCKDSLAMLRARQPPVDLLQLLCFRGFACILVERHARDVLSSRRDWIGGMEMAYSVVNTRSLGCF